jgi:hypothetical protein
MGSDEQISANPLGSGSADYRLDLGGELSELSLRPHGEDGQVLIYNLAESRLELSLDTDLEDIFSSRIFCVDLGANPGNAGALRLFSRNIDERVVIDAPLGAPLTYHYADDRFETNLAPSVRCFSYVDNDGERIFSMVGASMAQAPLFSDRFQAAPHLMIDFLSADSDQPAIPLRKVARRSEGEIGDFRYRVRLSNKGTLGIEDISLQLLEMFDDEVFPARFDATQTNDLNIICQTKQDSGANCGEIDGIGDGPDPQPLRARNIKLPAGSYVDFTLTRRLDATSTLGGSIVLDAGAATLQAYNGQSIFAARSHEIILIGDDTWIAAEKSQESVQVGDTLDDLNYVHEVTVRAWDTDPETECSQSIDSCSVPLPGVEIAVSDICLVQDDECDPIGSGLLLFDQSALTDENGAAVFRIASRLAGNLSVLFDVVDDTLRSFTEEDANQTSITLNFEPGPVDKLAFTQQVQEVSVGNAQTSSTGPTSIPSDNKFSVELELLDRFGNRADNDSDSVISLELNQSFSPTEGTRSGPVLGNADPQQAENGLVAFNELTINRVGQKYFLTATVEDSNPPIQSNSATFNIVAGEPYAIEIVQGSQLSGKVTETVGPLKVEVTDINDNPVPDVSVVFTASQGDFGNGEMPQMVETDTDGIAGISEWTLGQVAGTQTVTATVDGHGDLEELFTVDAKPGDVAELALSIDTEGDFTVDETIVGTVVAMDTHSNEIADVNVLVIPGNGLINGNTSAWIQSGTSFDWKLGQTAGPQTVTAQFGPDIDGDLQIDTIAAAPQSLSFDPDSVVITAGDSCQDVNVTITDEFTNPVINATVSAQVSDSGFDGDTCLPHEGSTSNNDGVASIPVGGITAGTWQVQIEVEYRDVVHDNFNEQLGLEISAGDPDLSASTLTADPNDDIPADGLSFSTLTATIKDEFDNPVGDGITVEFSLLSDAGNGGLSSEFVDTDENGEAVTQLTSTLAGEMVVRARLDGNNIGFAEIVFVMPQLSLNYHDDDIPADQLKVNFSTPNLVFQEAPYEGETIELIVTGLQEASDSEKQEFLDAFFEIRLQGPDSDPISAADLGTALGQQPGWENLDVDFLTPDLNSDDWRMVTSVDTGFIELNASLDQGNNGASRIDLRWIGTEKFVGNGVIVDGPGPTDDVSNLKVEFWVDHENDPDASNAGPAWAWQGPEGSAEANTRFLASDTLVVRPFINGIAYGTSTLEEVQIIVPDDMNVQITVDGIILPASSNRSVFDFKDDGDYLLSVANDGNPNFEEDSENHLKFVIEAPSGDSDEA